MAIYQVCASAHTWRQSGAGSEQTVTVESDCIARCLSLEPVGMQRVWGRASKEGWWIERGNPLFQGQWTLRVRAIPVKMSEQSSRPLGWEI